MPDYRILLLDIDEGEHYFIRRTAGGKDMASIAHFKAHRDRKIRDGQKPTRMDEIAGSAKRIDVTVLRELTDHDRREADQVKQRYVDEYRDKYGDRLINVH